MERDVVAVEEFHDGVQRPAGPGGLVPGTVRHGRGVVVQRAVVVAFLANQESTGVDGRAAAALLVERGSECHPMAGVDESRLHSLHATR